MNVKTAHKTIGYLATGGTISSTPASAGAGVTPSLTAEDLIAAAHPETDGVAFVAEQVSQLASSSFDFRLLRTLHRRVTHLARDGVDGIVITQGTDTLEETAFFFNSVWDRTTPVVLTGAMRNPGEIGADGARNLRTAVAVASDPAFVGLGPLVVMNDEVFAAGAVRKAHTSAVDAFVSTAGTAIGMVTEGTPRLFSTPRRSDPQRYGAGDPKVALYRCSLGDSDDILRMIEDGDFDGLVIEGFGGGHVPAWQMPTIERIAGRMPVVLSSRTGQGSVLERTYGFPGSETDLRRHGLVPSGALNGLQARMLLWILLSRSAGPQEIREAYAAC